MLTSIHLTHVRLAHLRRHTGGLLAAAMLFIVLLATQSVYAQKFEYVYGNTTNREAGRRGVSTVSEGGYIAVGESFSVPNPPDIYVVRTQDDGTLAWSFTYDVGDRDSATDVEEVKVPMMIPRHDTVRVGDSIVIIDTGWVVQWITDGFVVTGVTKWNRMWWGPHGPIWRTDRDLFLMRIDRCGNLRWFKTYGTDTTDEIGYDLTLATTGGGGMMVGDIIAVGSTTKRVAYGPGPRDAYLLRTDQNGNIRWDRTYDVADSGKDDYFYGVVEALSHQIPNWPADIVAVGGTTALGPDIDALVARVDGASGLVVAAPHTIGLFAWTGDEDLRAVIELKSYPYRDDLVVIGRTLTFDGGFSDVLTMRLDAQPDLSFARAIWGENLKDDEGYDLKEVLEGPYYDIGKIITTGYATLDTNYRPSLGAKDAFLQLIDPPTVLPLRKMHIFGGDHDDWGWSVNTVTSRTVGNVLSRTTGYVMCGFTKSDFFHVGDPEQLYLVKTNNALTSDCDDDSLDILRAPIPPSEDSFGVRYGQILQYYMPPVTWVCNKWFDTLCLDLDGTTPSPIPPCPPCNGPGPDPNDTSQHVKRAVPNDMLSDEGATTGALAAYPNPIRRGSMLNIRTKTALDAEVLVTVVDMSGSEIYRWRGKAQSGNSVVSVGTGGWPLGAYVVTLSSDGRTVSQRVVVDDR